MDWHQLTDSAALSDIRTASAERPQLIFKHSTRCGISMGALHRLEGGLDALGERFDLHFLDLLQHRDISNAIAETFGIRHQSPQVIVIDGGEAVFHTSHGVISPHFILEQTA